MKRSFKPSLVLFLKGLAMGAADVVPGVSGGTIAFISGIYEELLASISALDFSTLQRLRREGIKAVWKSINGSFLVTLLAGIAVSVVSLAKGISYLLENRPVLLWSFFFGLVLASVFFVGKRINKWNLATGSMLVLGTAIAYYITLLEPLVSEASSLWFLFLSGALAICAMILPGISGSFILVLLGAYKTILEAVHSRDLQKIAVVGAGAIVGLLSFSKLLKWLFSTYKNLTLSGLTGFIFGSLNKIWPWKEALSQKSVSPFQFEGESQLISALFLAVLGYGIIVALEKIHQAKN